MTDDLDLLARGDDLASRLHQQSRGHVIMDATMRKMSESFSLTGDPLVLDDKDARAGVEFARDAATVRRLMAQAAQARQPRGPLFVGLIGALIMFVVMCAVASAAVAYRLPALVTVPVILGGPLLGWALTTLRRRR